MSEATFRRRSTDAARPKRRPRWLWLLVIVAVTAAVVGGLQVPQNLDGGTRNLATLSTGGAAIVAATVWLMFFAGLGRRTRIVLLLVELLPLALLRLDGYTGDLWPIFAWRWSPAADHALVRSGGDVSAANTTAGIDLKPTPDDFPQFLGPDCRAEVDTVSLATDWSTAPRRLWQEPIGAGWSSFAVVGDYAFTQEQRGDDEMVVCYQRGNGAMVWSHADRSRFESVMGGDGPRATPTIHGGRVFVMSAVGRLSCLEGATGRVIWSRDVVAENGAKLPMWGSSCSPLIVENRVVVSSGGPEGHSLVAYQIETGDELWHGGDSPASYASPVLATIHGQRQIVMLNAEDVTGHDLETGKVLWQYPWPGGQPKVPQPVVLTDNRVLIAAGYGLGAKLLEISQSSGEVPKELWSSRSLRPKFTNVVVYREHIYGIDDGRTLNCLELPTGKLAWRSARSAVYGHGQVLRVGEVLLVQCENGDVALVAADSNKFQELARFHAIDGKTWNNPVLAGRYLLVRNAEQAACYELPLKK